MSSVQPCTDACVVRSRHGRGHARLRPASRARQHDHVCRREPALRHDVRRQDAPRVGLWHPRRDQVHCRSGNALDASGHPPPEQCVARGA
jgi:hypothetical protein